MPDLAPYAGAAEAGANLLSGIVKRILPEKISELDAAKMNQEITMALIRGEFEPMIAQARINEQEAASDNIFVSGWRPFVGWVCGSALAWQFIGLPLSQFFIALFEIKMASLPVFDYAQLSPILLGMLGLGAMRSYEKVKAESTSAMRVGS